MVAAEIQYRSDARRRHEWRLQRRTSAEADARARRAKARRLLERRRVEREEKRRLLLFSQAQEWRTAQDIRGFIADVLSRVESTVAREELAAWADWARSQADAIDPVLQARLLVSESYRS